jgi:predicted nucleotidyltransferase
MSEHRWVDKAVHLIVDHYAPDLILLFGSYAKGQETLHSDIDLLIVKNSELPRSERGSELSTYLTRYPIKFDLLFYTPSELQAAIHSPTSFMSSILATSVVLYRA